MKKYFSTVSLRIMMIICAVLWLAGPVMAEERYTIHISNPTIAKVPIAIPRLMTVSGGSKEVSAASEISQILADFLTFTGSFTMTDRAAYLEDPSKTGIDKHRINFKNWVTIGTEFLITGAVHIKNDYAYIELHLFDTIRAKELVAKKYKAKQKDLRQVIGIFATRVVKKVTGYDGLFDSKIAFISNGSGNKEIYICDFDGSNPVKITNENSITLSPSWSSDGRKLAYTSYRRGKPDIYIKNLRTQTVQVVASDAGSNITPVWIPGKNELVASLSLGGGQSIYKLTGNGKNPKRITSKWSEWGIDVSPTFSPDGDKMAFVSARSGTPQIFIKNLKNNKIERLTFSGRYNTSPSWSPDGKTIAYSGAADGHFDIFVIGTDGGEPVRLTENSGDNEDPSWAPDGSMIAFSSSRDGNIGIWVMTRYGTDQRRLFRLKGEQTSPRWSPTITR